MTDSSTSGTKTDIEIVRGTYGTAAAAWSIVVHGGAGDLPGAERDRELRLEGCRRAARAGAAVLAAGGSALDAAQRAVELLEDDPLFNAGTGACLTSDGKIELDASLMEGTHLRAGGVCALAPFRHPITIARAVLDDGGHVLYAADGAARFARDHGFTPSTDAEMTTAAARARWEAARRGEGSQNWAGGGDGDGPADAALGPEPRGGTVGAVARDVRGGVAAATSTGGRMNKRPGRVGDTPILGAGTYADDTSGACSNTGDGEAVMRVCLAKTATEWMRAGMAPEDAARAAIRLMGERVGGFGGLILVDRFGRLGLARSTPAMAWGAAAAGWPDASAGL